jgi:hypothetical protein
LLDLCLETFVFESVGNIHMHTPFSDGKKWHAEIAEDAIRAGLDFIIVTDHNLWISGIEGYYENREGRVMLLVGEELHNPRRDPQASHFLAIGADQELSNYTHDTQSLIKATSEAGGSGFLAHPFDRTAPAFAAPSLEWQDWGVNGYQGMELWNYMSSFKGLLTSRVKAVRAALEPDRYIIGPDPSALNKWDEFLANGNRMVVIGGSDAHGLTYTMWSITREIYPYEYLFRTVNTHIMTHRQLSGDFEQDKILVLQAISRGNCWVAYDLPALTTGFRFTGQSRSKGIMGEEILFRDGATLQVRTPEQCHIRMIHQGVVVADCVSDTNLTFIPNEPGPYRVECLIPHKGQERGWIYSNPIYLI